MCNIVSYNVCAMIKKISNKIKSFIKGDESNGRIKWSLYGRVWREVGAPYWKWLVAGIIFTILAAGAEAYTITIVQQVVDKAFIEKSIIFATFVDTLTALLASKATFSTTIR